MSELVLEVRPHGDAWLAFVCPHRVSTEAVALDFGPILRMRTDRACGCRADRLVLNFWEIDDAQRTLGTLAQLPGARAATLWRMLAAYRPQPFRAHVRLPRVGGRTATVHSHAPGRREVP